MADEQTEEWRTATLFAASPSIEVSSAALRCKGHWQVFRFLSLWLSDDGTARVEWTADTPTKMRDVRFFEKDRVTLHRCIFTLRNCEPCPVCWFLECFYAWCVLIISQCASIHDCAVGGSQLWSQPKVGWMSTRSRTEKCALTHHCGGRFDHLHRHILGDPGTGQ